MGIVSGLKSIFTVRGKATSLYERGMRNAKQDRFEAAINDYSAALELSNVPNDIKAMALFNRGLAYAAVKDEAKAKVDLQAVMSMDGAPSSVTTAAREKLERMKKRAKE